jgi:PAS domain S-box-containing protein
LAESSDPQREFAGSLAGADVLSDSEDLHDLFENAPCGYLSLTPDSRINRANATFSRWSGYSATELTSRRFTDLLSVAGRIYYETHFAPLLRMQGFFNEVALDLVARDGKRISILVNAVERRGANGELQFIRITIFNATDRRQYERELLEARKAAESAVQDLNVLNASLEQRVSEAIAERMEAEERVRRSQKMEAIGQLTGGVAHDFNNLLTVIIGGLDSIGRHVKRLPSEEAVARIHRARDMAEKGARRAATLTARLLAFSRQSALAPKVIEPNRLITDFADFLRRTVGEAISLETVYAAGLWRAFADPDELENVLINLAANARDAMPNGGRLTIETNNASLDEAYVTEFAEPILPGQYVMIAVADTGAGMSAETVSRVFEPFFTTKGVGKGTGLGLSQVYGFARQSGGHVRLYSELGHGTTVKLYLPRDYSTDAKPEKQLSQTKELHGGSETILIVEDDAELQSWSVSILDELGYSVMSASSGPEALKEIRSNKHIDLLFTDVVLPDGMTGRMLADEACRIRPSLKVLFTTGYTRNAIVHHGRLDPGVNLLSKPFSFDELALKVRTMLDDV